MVPELLSTSEGPRYEPIDQVKKDSLGLLLAIKQSLTTSQLGN